MIDLIEKYLNSKHIDRNKLCSDLLAIFDHEARMFDRPEFGGQQIYGRIYVDSGHSFPLPIEFDYYIKGHYTKDDLLDFEKKYITNPSYIFKYKNSKKKRTRIYEPNIIWNKLEISNDRYITSIEYVIDMPY